MSSSIFKKLLVYYISVTLIGFILMGAAINFGLQELLINKKADALFEQAGKMAEALAQTTADPSQNMQYQTTVAFNKHFANTKVDLLLLEEGGSLRKVLKLKKKLLKRNDIDDPAILDNVLSGQRIKHIGTFKKTEDQVLLSIGIPIYENNKVTGALFLHTPIQEIPLDSVSIIIVNTAIFIIIPAIAALYMISRKISRPLVRMNQATRQIGKGNFKERVDIKSKDEVGQLAATFNEMAQQLEKLESMRKELIANVSHELRTPLTSVRGFIQGMKEGVIPAEQQQRYLEVSYQELNRLSTLLNIMLDLSAIESGRVTLHPVVIRWASLVETVADSVMVRMKEKKISFTIEQPENEIVKVYGDPERLKQVLFNLLDNAIRYTPEGGGITIQSRMLKDKIEVKISDTGMGIDPEKLHLIWERFYTEESSRMSRRERSGLGLTITKQLVELMKGTIHVTSTLGEGTTFTLYLPNSPS
jgi:signal transduction histidine kinase